MNTKRILVADDEENLRKLISVVLQAENYEVILASDGEETLQLYEQFPVDLMLIDIRMPKMDGLQVLEHVKQGNNELPVILMTAYAGIETAVQALQQGAFDYIVKPFDLDELKALIIKALNHQSMIKSEQKLTSEIEMYEEGGKSEKILTNSTLMMELIRNIAKISQTNATVLITGESGTGKELVAKAIHYYSKRSTGPFIKVNCGALPETLLESTLFGHEKGAFTGAQKRQSGLFERANHGTLLLDELGEMSPNLQVKLLRVLQEKEFEPIGSNQTIHTDFRLIAATNKNLEAMVKDGMFRQDLFYRLNVMPINIPPLRERTEDIALLANHFIHKFCLENNREVMHLTEEALDILNCYSWPGNVRELSNAIEHAVVMSIGNLIYPDDLPQYLFKQANIEDLGDQSNYLLKNEVKNYERDLIINALKTHHGHREQTAKALGISKRTLMYKIQEYNIE